MHWASKGIYHFPAACTVLQSWWPLLIESCNVFIEDNLFLEIVNDKMSMSVSVQSNQFTIISELILWFLSLPSPTPSWCWIKTDVSNEWVNVIKRGESQSKGGHIGWALRLFIGHLWRWARTKLQTWGRGGNTDWADLWFIWSGL